MGIGLTYYLQRVRRPRLEMHGGIAALAAMRWREFSHFVIEALQAQGFEVSRTTPMAERGKQADLLLHREGRDWLLSCKQGANYRIGRKQVDELADAVRFDNAAGGVLATLGRIDPEARRNPRGIELIDGATLWSLIDPLIPPSLHQDLSRKAQLQARREQRLGWALAVAMGLAVGVLVAMLQPSPTAAVDPTTDPRPAAAPAPSRAPVAEEAPAQSQAAPAAAAGPALDEEAQRRAVAEGVSTVPGVDRAVWTTPSTLLIYQSGLDIDSHVSAICAVVERYPDLRASRLQLQPPPGSGGSVRFRQCRAF
ncbi:restriction endonuclease [Lysobacter sp. A3-1-A15]|uniref:restriction endonuclease n=1 Tax=Novilysobacter viscosus TaxID=3098602 RepID=UPI002ED943F6